MKKFLMAAAAATAMTLAMAGSANAVTYILDIGNSSGPENLAGYTGPFGTADVVLDTSSKATITFTSDISGTSGFLYYFGDGGSVGVNSNGAATLGNISGDSTGSPHTPIYTNAGAGTEDGWGSFSNRVTSFDGFQYKSHQISFDLTLTSGSWASAEDVLTANASGNAIAAHVFVANADGSNHLDPITGTGVTGFATVGAVPEAATWALMIVGFGFIGFAMRRRPKEEGIYA
jgi:hypothetical protein